MLRRFTCSFGHSAFHNSNVHKIAAHFEKCQRADEGRAPEIEPSICHPDEEQAKTAETGHRSTHTQEATVAATRPAMGRRRTWTGSRRPDLLTNLACSSSRGRIQTNSAKASSSRLSNPSSRPPSLFYPPRLPCRPAFVFSTPGRVFDVFFFWSLRAIRYVLSACVREDSVISRPAIYAGGNAYCSPHGNVHAISARVYLYMLPGWAHLHFCKSPEQSKECARNFCKENGRGENFPASEIAVSLVLYWDITALKS